MASNRADAKSTRAQPAPREFDDEVLELVAERFQVLAEPMRLRILNHLRDGEMTVGALVEATGGRQANISRHLGALLAQGFVSRRKEGVFAYYRIQDPGIFELCALVCDSLQARLRARQDALGGGEPRAG